jgi:hypothetical protein
VWLLELDGPMVLLPPTISSRVCNAQRADAALFDAVDTPGGLDHSMRTIKTILASKYRRDVCRSECACRERRTT